MAGNKDNQRRSGYTLVETTLAMAVGASLFMLTFGLATMVSNARFKDTMNSAYSFVQTRYSDAQNGINSRVGSQTGNGVCGDDNQTALAGNKENCYFLGYELDLYRNSGGSSKIISRQLYGSKPASAGASWDWPDQSKSSDTNLQNINIKADESDTAGTANEKSIDNGTIVGVWSTTGRNDEARTISTDNNGKWAIRLVRDPLGANSLTSSYSDNQGNFSSFDGNAVIAVAIQNDGTGYAGGLLCIGGGGSGAGLSYSYNFTAIDYGSRPENLNHDQRRAISNECYNWESQT